MLTTLKDATSQTNGVGKMRTSMNQLFNCGDTFRGYCGGLFGRDDYADKRVVIINRDYIVLEYADGRAVVLNYYDGIENDVENNLFGIREAS